MGTIGYMDRTTDRQMDRWIDGQMDKVVVVGGYKKKGISLQGLLLLYEEHKLNVMKQDCATCCRHLTNVAAVLW